MRRLLFAIPIVAVAVAIIALSAYAAFGGRGANNAAQQVSALHLPPPAAVPAAVTSAFEMPRSSDQGTAIPATARKIASGLGQNNADMWIFSTTRGSVCFVVTDLVAAGTCVDRFDNDGAPTGIVIYRGQGMPTSIAGLAPDDVSAVSVVDNAGARRSLAISHGGFFAQGLGRPITGVDFTHVDGSHEWKALKAPPTG